MGRVTRRGDRAARSADRRRAGEYFSDGITEEILNALTRVRELNVASSFSFKGKDTDIHEIAAKLKVAHVLEGSVRRAGDRLRATEIAAAAERENAT